MRALTADAADPFISVYTFDIATVKTRNSLPCKTQVIVSAQESMQVSTRNSEGTTSSVTHMPGNFYDRSHAG